MIITRRRKFAWHTALFLAAFAIFIGMMAYAGSW